MRREHVLALLLAWWPELALRAGPIEATFGPENAGTWQVLGELEPAAPRAPRVEVRASFRLQPSPGLVVEFQASRAGPPDGWFHWAADGTYRATVKGQEYVVRIRGLAPRPWVQVFGRSFVAKVSLAGAAPGTWSEHTLVRSGWRARCRVLDQARNRFEVQLVAPDGHRLRVLSVTEDRDGEQPYGEETLVVSCSPTKRVWGTVQVFGPQDPKPLALELEGLVERPLGEPEGLAPDPSSHRPPTVDEGEAEDDVAVLVSGAAPANVTVGRRRVTWGSGRHELVRWQYPEGGSLSESGYVFVDRTARTWSVPFWLYTGSVSSAQAWLFPDGTAVLGDELGLQLPRLFVLSKGGPVPVPVPYAALETLRDEAVERSLVAAGRGARHEPSLTPVRVTAVRREGWLSDRLALTAEVEVSLLVQDRPERHRWRIELTAVGGRALGTRLTPLGAERR